jgi:hypothetical protein
MKNRISKLLIFLIIFSLTITGCKTFGKAASTRTYGFQPPIKQLYWGMPLNKIEKVLSIKNGVDGVVYSYEKPVTIIKLKNKVKEFGCKATIYLEVYDKPKEKWFPYQSSYLSSVSLIYKNSEGKTVKENIEKQYDKVGKDSVDFLGNNCTTWESEDKIKDLSQNDKKNLKEFWKVVDEHTKSTKNFPATSIAQNDNEEINSITFVNSKKDTKVTFTGNIAVQLNQLDKHKLK